MDGLSKIFGWMDRHAKLVIAIYLLSSLVMALAVGSVIFHFIMKLW